VVALGNLCVDVVQPVISLPPVDKQLLKQLTAAPPNTDSWELGGSCNFTIAASRLGLKAATVGHVAADVYGDFLRDVLRVSRLIT
jgi:sugar/nucleoside kinase (ribokinase family)